MLDFSSVIQEELTPGEVFRYHAENGVQISRKGENGKYAPWYYDGENCELRRNFTGHGLLVGSDYLTVGDFENGQADGDVVSFMGLFITHGEEEILYASDGGYDTCMDVSELHMENGVLTGEAVRRRYIMNPSGQPVLMSSVRGNAVPVRVLTEDIAKDVIFCLDGRVEYVTYCINILVESFGQYERRYQTLQPPKEYVFYLQADCIDEERCQNVDGQWLDESGQAISELDYYRSGEVVSWCQLTVSESMFDLDSLQITEIREESETK